MENVNARVYRPTLVRATAPVRPVGRKYRRPLADRLEWVALVVLSITSLAAAVSLLGWAIR